jgi:hypothetical protein
MADAGPHMAQLTVGPQRHTQIVRGQRLSDRADVVILTFHRKKNGALDRGRLDFPVLVSELPERQPPDTSTIRNILKSPQVSYHFGTSIQIEMIH